MKRPILLIEQFPVFDTVKGVIFDLDGVLVDTAIFHFQAWKQLANSLGFDFTEKQNEQLKGVSRIRSLELILAWGGISKTAREQELLANQKNSWYLDLVNKMKPGDTLPGAIELLTCLKENNYKIALGSASKNALLILERTGIVNFFDVIVDGNTVTASKPAPEVFLKGAKSLNIDSAKCLVLEDAQAGIDAARAAGMYVIGIGKYSGLTGANCLINNLNELLED
ncbi:beta-phosphoglucomutase [Olivibacter domesticus]|uniref:Beta-phosphoglucomutase n=1 Tax=Olivibacter domesticus TaxID=407022 RepID=A0A1H7LAL0_OLID1|nr:beta-phosphoglucomutase [Olivibacter domesticus]SEK95989.1 beta-phosphoglucomutase [Olivibacter domesticus]